MKVIQELKLKHSIVITADDLNSFSKLRPHIDTLLTKIMMGSVVLSCKVESTDNYSVQATDYQKSLNFLRTFQLENDSDDIAVEKLVRYTCFLTYITKTMIGWKHMISVMDLSQTNPSIMSNLLLSLSDLASFANSVTNNIKTVIEEIVKDKGNQKDYLEEYERKERELLKEVSTYECLVDIKDGYLRKFDQCEAKNKALKSQLDELTNMTSEAETRSHELESRMSSLTKEIQDVESEIRALRIKYVETPEKLGLKVADVKIQIEEEERRYNIFTEQCSSLTSRLQKVSTMNPYLALFNETIGILRKSSDKLSGINQEKMKHIFSKRELFEELKNEYRNELLKNKQMKNEQDKNQKIIDELTEKTELYHTTIFESREKLELARLRNTKYKNIGNEEIEKEKERRATLTKQYDESLTSLQDNVSMTMEEIMKGYETL